MRYEIINLRPGATHFLACPICFKTLATVLRISEDNKTASYEYHCEHFATDREELIYKDEYVYRPINFKNCWGVIAEG